MPRTRLILSTDLPYHVSARCNNRDLFPVPLPVVWETIGDVLWDCQVVHGIAVHAFVLMPNHFHLLVTAPRSPLPKITQFIMVEVTRRIHQKAGKCGHLFQGPHHRSLIRDTAYYRQALKYILRNPVKAGLCEKAEDWPYSSLQFLLGTSRPKFGLSPPILPVDIGMGEVTDESTLEWINRDYPSSGAESQVRRALRKRIFSVSVPKTG